MPLSVETREALHQATTTDDVDAIKSMIEQNHDEVVTELYYMLSSAISDKNFSSVSTILKAHPNVAKISDERGNFPLMQALDKHEPRITELLLNVYPDAGKKGRYPALCMAVDDKKVSQNILERIIKLDPDATEQSKSPGGVYSFCAALKKAEPNIEHVKLLFSESSRDVIENTLAFFTQFPICRDAKVAQILGMNFKTRSPDTIRCILQEPEKHPKTAKVIATIIDQSEPPERETNGMRRERNPFWRIPKDLFSQEIMSWLTLKESTALAQVNSWLNQAVHPANLGGKVLAVTEPTVWERNTQEEIEGSTNPNQYDGGGAAAGN